MNDINQLYELWLHNTETDSETHSELEAIRGNEKEILERFYKNLHFGTAGIRGILGAGTNRINKYTIGQTTRGLADYLNEITDSPRVAIGYDSRINSDVFARLSAGVLAANGITAYIFPCLMPTPLISYAVRALKCDSGIVITASHNPCEYNGYKCYDPNGYQMTEESADKVYAHIQKTDPFNDVKITDFDKALKEGKIRFIDEKLTEDFLNISLSLQIHPELDKSKIKLIYSPLNGAGNIPVRTVLERAGYKNVSVVKEQEMPDGNFPTCPFPNPEIRQAFDCGLKMAKKEKPDLLFATDPDCDRIGVAVPHKGDYCLITGNEMGALLANYLLSQRKATGTLPETPVVIKSFVSTKLVNKICKKYNALLIETLMGFKYIGSELEKLAKEGHEDDFIMAFEESYGYLLNPKIRDKDAVAASLLICEMTAYYHNLGLTLVDALDGLYEEFGASFDKESFFIFEGADGMTKMNGIMAKARANPPKAVAGFTVKEYFDYSTSLITDAKSGETRKITLPQSNILAYSLEGGHFAIMRPSGTEPKIKFYITGEGKTVEEARINAENINESMKSFLL